MEYNWKVTGLKTKDEGQFQNAVVQTYWLKTGINVNGISGSFAGATPLIVNNESGSFTAFEDLTEPVVIGWITGSLSDFDHNHINQEINKKIDKQVTPEKEPDLPW